MGVPYLGDFALSSQVIHHKWPSSVNGRPSAPSSVTIKVYKDDDTSTEVTTGITSSLTHDSLTGINHFKLVISDAFYTTGHDYFVVVTAATLGGGNVVDVLFSFSIQNRAVQLANVAHLGTSLNIINSAGNAVTFKSTAVSGYGFIVDSTLGVAMFLNSFETGVGAFQINGPIGFGENVNFDDDLQINGFSLKTLAILMSGSYTGIVQTATATTITLDVGASAVDDYYNDQVIVITNGTGVKQSRRILDYTGSTKVAVISTGSTNWKTNPDNTSQFVTIGRIE